MPGAHKSEAPGTAHMSTARPCMLHCGAVSRRTAARAEQQTMCPAGCCTWGPSTSRAWARGARALSLWSRLPALHSAVLSCQLSTVTSKSSQTQAFTVCRLLHLGSQHQQGLGLRRTDFEPLEYTASSAPSRRRSLALWGILHQCVPLAPVLIIVSNAPAWLAPCVHARWCFILAEGSVSLIPPASVLSGCWPSAGGPPASRRCRETCWRGSWILRLPWIPAVSG